MKTGVIRQAYAVAGVALGLFAVDVHAQGTAWEATSNLVLKTAEFREAPLGAVIRFLNDAISANLTNGPALTVRLNCTPPRFIKSDTNPVVAARMDEMIAQYAKKHPEGPDVWDPKALESRTVTLQMSNVPFQPLVRMVARSAGLSVQCQAHDILLGALDAGRTFECRAFPVPEGVLRYIAEADGAASPSSPGTTREAEVQRFFENRGGWCDRLVSVVPGTNLVMRLDTPEGNVQFADFVKRLFAWPDQGAYGDP